MHVRPLDSLSKAEIADIAFHAAERGECLEDVNPFPQGTARASLFARAFNDRTAQLGVVAAAR